MFAAIRILILVYWSPMTLLLYLFWHVNLKRGLEKADYVLFVVAVWVVFTDAFSIHKTTLPLFSWATSATTNSLQFFLLFCKLCDIFFCELVFHNSSGLRNSLKISVLKIIEHHPSA